MDRYLEQEDGLSDAATKSCTAGAGMTLNFRSVARVSLRRNATSSLPLTRASARSGESWLETVISILGNLLSGQEAQRERLLGGLSSASCRFARRIDLSQRLSGMVEKDPTRRDAVSTANHQLSADLVLTVRLPSSATATK